MNILRKVFTRVGSKSAKKNTDNLTCLFAHLGSARVKAARKTLVKLTLKHDKDIDAIILNLIDEALDL